MHYDKPTEKVVEKLREKFPTLHDDYFVTTSPELESYADIGENNANNIDGTPDPEDAYATHNPRFYEARSPTESNASSRSRSASRSRSVSRSRSSSSLRCMYLDDLYASRSLLTPYASAKLCEFLNWLDLRSDWDKLLLQGTFRPTDETSPHIATDWPSYLTEVLRVANLPRLATTSSDYGPVGPGYFENPTYKLSEEFQFLFANCDISDVLHVLLSKGWRQYSKLIDTHGELDEGEQDEIDELRESLWPIHNEIPRKAMYPKDPRKMLLYDLGNVHVQTSLGETSLCDCVLPNIDARFEDDTQIRLPTLNLGECCVEEKARLRALGVSVGAASTFYIKCLRSLRDSHEIPSPGTVIQLYEEIQSRYDGNISYIRFVKYSSSSSQEDRLTRVAAMPWRMESFYTSQMTPVTVSNRRGWEYMSLCLKDLISFQSIRPASICFGRYAAQRVYRLDYY